MPLSDELKREIGQHFVFGFHGYEINDNIKTLIKEYWVGNVILMKRNVRDVLQVRRLVHDLQAYAKDCGHDQPLMIGIDQENGLVSAFSGPNAGTTFPGAMALAAASEAPQGSSVIRDVATASGKELKAVGINWAYAPVADVNSDMNNPVIGVRSFGDDPLKVAAKTTEYATALRETGVAPCAKHFPGHGDTSVDSHLALPQIHKDLDQLTRTELVPFSALTDYPRPIATIMTGHMALPELEKQLNPALIQSSPSTPASLSRTITTHLLRERIEFQGVIVTDCLEMDAISQPSQGGCGVEEGAFRALDAGADIVMICHSFHYHVAAVKRVWRAFDSDELRLDEHAQSLSRIQYLKTAFAGSWQSVLPSLAQDTGFITRWNLLTSTSEGVSHASYQKSIALISDKASVLPLSPYSSIRLYTPRMESLNKAVDDAENVLEDGSQGNRVGPSYQHLADCIKKRLPQAIFDHRVYDPSGLMADDLVDTSKTIVFVLRNAHAAPWQIEALRQVMLGISKDTPVVILSSCLPYDLVSPAGGSEFRDFAAHVACFEYTSAALEAACQFIFGEPSGKGAGKIPVSNGRV